MKILNFTSYIKYYISLFLRWIFRYVIGNIIGSGIFISPSTIIRYTDSAGLSLIIWVIGALIAFLGKFKYYLLAFKGIQSLSSMLSPPVSEVFLLFYTLLKTNQTFGLKLGQEFDNRRIKGSICRRLYIGNKPYKFKLKKIFNRFTLLYWIGHEHSWSRLRFCLYLLCKMVWICNSELIHFFSYLPLQVLGCLLIHVGFCPDDISRCVLSLHIVQATKILTNVPIPSLSFI
jgi:hypothetical protein